jgi:hypothetical protein
LLQRPDLTVERTTNNSTPTQLGVKEGTSTMMAISMDGATTAASDLAPDGALAAPENHAILCETADEKAVLSANEKLYQAWRLIVQRHASKAAESLEA